MTYYLIRWGEDGDVHMSEHSGPELLKEIEEDLEYGATFLDKVVGGYGNIVGNMIVKGEIIVPTPVEKVTEWEIK